jgi:hypothetical protein
MPAHTPVAPNSSVISVATDSSVGAPIVSGAQVANINGVAATAKGLNAYDNAGVNGFDLEPPDQGLCAGNGYVVEPINLIVTVYSTSFTHLSSDVSLATLVGFPIAQLFGASSVGGGYLLSDPRCLYDPTSGHWFISFLYLGGAGVFSNSGPFPLGPHTYGAEFVLASTTTSPLGSYNVYVLNVTNTRQPGHPNCPCFGDQPVLGSDANSIIISTNEFAIFCNCFDGAQVYLWDKLGLANGFNFLNVVAFDTGLLKPLTGSVCHQVGSIAGGQ